MDSLRDVADGLVVCEVPASGWLTNPAGVLYGGVQALVADYALSGPSHVRVLPPPFVALLAAGIPVSTALGLGIAADCISMVLMMAAGGHRHHRHVSGHGATEPAPTGDDPLHTTGTRR